MNRCLNITFDAKKLGGGVAVLCIGGRVVATPKFECDRQWLAVRVKVPVPQRSCGADFKRLTVSVGFALRARECRSHAVGLKTKPHQVHVTSLGVHRPGRQKVCADAGNFVGS